MANTLHLNPRGFTNVLKETQFSQKIFIVTAHTGNIITLHYPVKAL